MQIQKPLARRLAGVACCALLGGCASTTVVLNPSPQAPVCSRTNTALVLWAPQWRPDQKDVGEREAAAARGLQEFFEPSGCFATSAIRRVPDVSPDSVSAQLVSAAGQFDRVVVIAVRELGPVVKLLSFPALVDGGTEVLLGIAEYAPSGSARPREFTVYWKHGGPGVVKGVASLPGDMQAALLAGLQPGAAQSPLHPVPPEPEPPFRKEPSC
jgi:hypothetical protein